MCIRDTVHTWLAHYEAEGLERPRETNRIDPKPLRSRCRPVIEAQSCSSCDGNRPSLGPGEPAPPARPEKARHPCPRSRGSIAPCVRHGLIEPKARRKKLPTYKRWERGRPMELWQMDVVGGVLLEDGTECKVLTGVDDHSRFCVCAGVMDPSDRTGGLWVLRPGLRAPRRARRDPDRQWQGLHQPLRPHPFRSPLRQDLPGERHHPSPHRSGLADHHRQDRTLPSDPAPPSSWAGQIFSSLRVAQRELDAWVGDYNTERPHQSLGMATPAQRLRGEDKALRPDRWPLTCVSSPRTARARTG